MNVYKKIVHTGNPAKIVAINYANERFKTLQVYNTWSALQTGRADEVIAYGEEDLDAEFRSKYATQLAYKRGGGLWIWKPYFILRTLESMQDGEYLFYCDSGTMYIDRISLLLDSLIASGQDIMVFDISLYEREWSKKEAIDKILGGIDDDSRQRLGGYIMLKNSERTRRFVNEWISYCVDPVCNTPECVTGTADYPGFVRHSDDQSVLSLLSKKWGYIPFRDPSQYGSRPWEYSYAKLGRWFDVTTWRCDYYRHKNSPYPQILVSIRDASIETRMRKERNKRFLARIGLCNIYIDSICRFINRLFGKKK